MADEPKKITYFNCNKHTVILNIIIIPSLVILGLFINLSVYTNYFNYTNYCNPISFFWANDNVCIKFIEKTVKDTLNNKESINESSKKSTDGFTQKIQTNFENSYTIFNDSIVSNYLAIIDLIQSFNEFVLLLIIKKIRNLIRNI